MKKILFIAAAYSLSLGIHAQDNNLTDARARLLFGIKGGLNYSNVYDERGEAFTADPKFGLAAGIFLAIPIGTYLGIQPELMISQRGFKSTGSILGNRYELTRTTTYLDIPLLFAFKPSEFITILGGPQFSYLLQQKDAFANGTTSIETEKEFENDNIRKNILCLTGGLDLTLKHIVLGARAGVDLQTNHGNGNSSTPRYKNVWYQATIGYRFYK
jgi:hypothetical protein